MHNAHNTSNKNLKIILGCIITNEFHCCILYTCIYFALLFPHCSFRLYDSSDKLFSLKSSHSPLRYHMCSVSPSISPSLNLFLYAHSHLSSPVTCTPSPPTSTQVNTHLLTYTFTIFSISQTQTNNICFLLEEELKACSICLESGLFLITH